MHLTRHDAPWVSEPWMTSADGACSWQALDTQKAEQLGLRANVGDFQQEATKGLDHACVFLPEPLLCLKEVLHHFETMGNHCLLVLNCRGILIAGFLGWCELDFVHQQYSLAIKLTPQSELRLEGPAHFNPHHYVAKVSELKPARRMDVLPTLPVVTMSRQASWLLEGPLLLLHHILSLLCLSIHFLVSFLPREKRGKEK